MNGAAVRRVQIAAVRFCGAALAAACLFLSIGCGSRAAINWQPVLHTTDSLVTAGDTTAALEAIRDVLQRAKRRSGDVDTSFTAMADTLAGLMVRVGDLGLAEQLYRLALREQELQTDADFLVRTGLLERLGTSLASLGQFDEARAAVDSAFAICRERSLESHWPCARVFSAEAHLHFAAGAMSQAAGCWEQALARGQQLLPADDPQLASLWSNLGNAYAELMHGDSAEAAYLRALQILERLRPPRHYERVAVVANLAALYADLGRYDEAMSYGRQGLKDAGEALGANHERVADILHNLATVAFYTGDLDEAEVLFRQAEAVYDAQRGTPTSLGRLELNLGVLYLYSGQWDDAEKRARRSLELIRTGRGEEHPEGVPSLELLAAIDLARGNWNAAREHQRTAYRIGRGQFLSQYLTLSESSALEYSQGYRHLAWSSLATLLSCEDMRIDSSREIADIVLESKGMVQDGALMRQSLLRKHRDPHLEAKLDSLRALRIRRAQLAFSMEQLAGTRSMQKELAALRKQSAGLERQAGRLEKDIVQGSPLHREYVDVPPDSVYAVLRRLPPESAVVDYFTFFMQDPDDSFRSHYLGIVLSDTGLVACVHLGYAEAINNRIAAYRDLMSNPRVATAAQVNRASYAVYEAVWRPLEDYLTAAKIVFICPDGELNTVSFAGLPDRNGRYLIEHHAIQYLATTRDLVRLARSDPPQGTGILLVGAPAYQGQLPDLKHAKQEVTNVADSWRATFTEPAEMLTGENATEHNFRRSFTGKRITYFAAHSAETISTPDRHATASVLPNGIVLADYRRTRMGDAIPEQDGLLTAEEISTLDLDGSELAVLSLCESGGGRLVTGEGVYGLRRAFQMAGVPTVISTLWPVDDLATAELMKYGLFDRATSYPEVLRMACLARKEDLAKRGEPPNPYYWAAFVSTGGWRRWNTAH